MRRKNVTGENVTSFTSQAKKIDRPIASIEFNYIDLLLHQSIDTTDMMQFIHYLVIYSDIFSISRFLAQKILGFEF